MLFSIKANGKKYTSAFKTKILHEANNHICNHAQNLLIAALIVVSCVIDFLVPGTIMMLDKLSDTLFATWCKIYAFLY